MILMHLKLHMSPCFRKHRRDGCTVSYLWGHQNMLFEPVVGHIMLKSKGRMRASKKRLWGSKTQKHLNPFDLLTANAATTSHFASQPVFPSAPEMEAMT